ncbi:MAG: MBL fold metallo-hydrolase [Desulfobacterales bacterium]|jgi:ribonuclease Z
MSTLYFVGTGTPTPTKSRFGTCYILRVGDEFLMFDCGPAATHKLVKMGLFPTQIDYLFFSHHHFDHNADYPCFLLCRWDQSIGRENILKVWGPPPTQWVTDRLIGPQGAFNHDWRARVGHPGSQEIFVKRGGTLPRPAPKVIVADIRSGDVIYKDPWTVTAAKAQHIEPWMTTLAYRIDFNGHRIVITSDTGDSPSVLALAEDADTLLTHCWDHQKSMQKNEAAMIGGTLAAAKLAQKAGVRTLILAHQGSNLDRPGSREKAVTDISRIFEGEIIFAEESLILEI